MLHMLCFSHFCCFTFSTQTYHVHFDVFFFSPFFPSQLHWNIYPICFLPERDRRTPISGLEYDTLEMCIEFIDNDRNDAASISENILFANGISTLSTFVSTIFCFLCCESIRFDGRRFQLRFCFIFFYIFIRCIGDVNLYALIGGVVCIVMAILIVVTILSIRRHSAKYYTNEDKRNGKP